MGDCHGCPAATITRPAKTRRQIVAIVGPPNSGKSTLFNRLTGLRQKVANFPGVTVEHRMGRARLDGDHEVYLVDLPGVYSLTPRTEDERVTHDVLGGAMKDMPKPDAVLLILDSTNLSRHLVLAAPVLSLGLPTLVILNMADDLDARGGEVDSAELAMQLGSPVALVSAAKGIGIEKVMQFLAGTTQGAPARNGGGKPLMELPVIQDIPKCRAWAAHAGSKARYHAPAPPLWTRRLDAIFLHPLLGPLIFLLVVIGVFETIFAGAQPLMDAIDDGIQASGAWVASVISYAPLRSLLVDGVWSGVGSVVKFLPQILILFLFIGILEDSGYLARAALIADRTMARIGLQGKSFIPLLSAYACAVPAIMATRTIENKRDRIATILIAPFMTCSARLPVYTLVIAAFIAPKYQVLALLSLYIIGFLAAIGTAKLLKSTILKSARSSFMLEMPPYRWPTPRSLGLRLVDRAKVFLRRAGTVILAVAIVIWVLGHLPLKNGAPPPIDQSIEAKIGHAVEPAIKPLGFNWKIGIGLISSLAAREVIVGTLGTIYGMEGSSEHSVELQKALRRDLTPGGAAALLVFFAFAMQCMSTIAVVRRETMSWKWPALQFAYMTLFAYAAAFAANHAVLWLA
ncbi:MAG TPA: ferrous iron transport protein B [Bryobacteraceae bacterium]|jgi:ferrous iron transport protein B|nr:ferrous iron transport protein B [Bryobacteraceae bacterium]